MTLNNIFDNKMNWLYVAWLRNGVEVEEMKTPARKVDGILHG
jgi:hypothetical protein